MSVRTKNKYTVSAILLGAIMAVLLSIALVASASAADTATANTLQVSPVRTDTQLDPGTVKTLKVTVTNPTDSTILVRPFINDFVSGDQDGRPALILGDDEFAPSRSLKRFVTPLEDVSLAAGESKTINVVITVPADAPAGGYLGALRLAPTDPDSGGQVNMSASVASLILMTVSGEMVEKIDLTNFDVRQDDKPSTVFFNPTGLAVSTLFQNQGNVQIGPFGKISLRKGDTVVYEVDFNNKNPRDMVLAESARRWSIPLEETSGFGQYTVVATFAYGSMNQSIEISKSFWVITTTSMIIAGASLLVIIGAIIGTVLYLKKRRRSNSHRGRSSSTNYRRR
jgi:hypothetical protein